MSNYGSVVGGDTFFDARLHNFDWKNATASDKLGALVEATELIDQFSYIGDKYAVAILDDPTDEEIRLAELSQELQFPRGLVNEVPAEVERACYLIAIKLLGGRDPELDLENLASTSQVYGTLSTKYDRTGNTQQHLAHLIPSPQAFNLLLPFMREAHSFSVKRV